MADSQSSVSPVSKASLPRRTIVAVAIGNFVEWFDFALYAIFASIIATVFFPSDNELTSLLTTFAVFGVAIVARPAGALLFGHLGDRMGRSRTLSTVILLMSVSTALIGLLPSHATAGAIAPVCLVMLRVFQGFAAGGEYGGAASYVLETAPPERRGLYASIAIWTQLFAVAVGLLTGTLLSRSLTADQLASWGWRLPFLLALPLGAVGLYMRRKLEDPAVFIAASTSGEVHSAPLAALLRGHGRDLLKVVGLVVYGTSGAYLLLYLPTYSQTILEVSPGTSFGAALAALLAATASVPVSAAVSDRIGRRPCLLAMSMIATVLMYPAFLLLHGDSAAYLAAHLVIGFVVGAYAGPMSAAIAEAFPTALRYSGLSVGYGVATSVFGGMTPLALTALLGATGNQLAPAWFFIATALISFGAAWVTAETAGKPLRAS
ncbi:MFS transporter [Streptomyces sp. NPDC056296]|uniref:MFS transporter n=1 Tax=Streptomyces sp. NPDC056296 TaxID=3345775 RepID=UPI0035DA7409